MSGQQPSAVRRPGRLRKTSDRRDRRPLGLKPLLILRALRGAKAPLFHGTTGIEEFFRNLLDIGPWPSTSPQLSSTPRVYRSSDFIGLLSRASALDLNVDRGSNYDVSSPRRLHPKALAAAS